METLGLRPARQHHACWHELVGEKCPGAFCTSPSDIPAFDHGEIWKNHQGELVITFQPYDL